MRCIIRKSGTWWVLWVIKNNFTLYTMSFNKWADVLTYLNSKEATMRSRFWA